jgi:predicted DNA-binding protein (MmcQ/YjbR family)
MDMKEMFKQGPSDVERWTQGLHAGIKRWKGVEQQRKGLGDVFVSNGEAFAEMSYTMREVHVRIKLGKTQQQRAVQLGSARPAREMEKEGWVDIAVDGDEHLQNAINLARQAYRETQR